MAAASSFVGGLVGAVKLRLLVDNATSTNDDPTPSEPASTALGSVKAFS